MKARGAVSLVVFAVSAAVLSCAVPGEGMRGAAGEVRPAYSGAVAPLAVRPRNAVALPLQRPSDALNAPMVHLGQALHLNPGVAPASGSLNVVAEHGKVRVAYGRVADGAGARMLIEYLSAEARETSGIRKPYRLTMTVRVVEGATPEMVDQTVRAVQWINAALPREHRLRFDAALVPRKIAETSGTFQCDRVPCDEPAIPNGDILVRFAPAEIWLGAERAAKTAHISGQGEFDGWVLRRSTGEHRRSHWAGQVWVDPARATGDSRLHVLVHEMLHVLGRHHADPERFPESVMRPVYGPVRPGAILDPLDREVLLAVHGRLGPHAAPNEIARTLRSWEHRSTHVHGELDAAGAVVAFGVGLRNGLARPWARGPVPHTGLAESPGLSGGRAWAGRFLGFTRDHGTVAGAADLTIRSDARTGTLRLTEAEFWPGGQPPGAPGSGTRWSQGDLFFEVVVGGNRFVRAGRDAGQITAGFFGDAHQGMGGVVEGGDFTASFGGKR